ncbi:surface lipoprotein assembly modifier [Emcibacter nanhaiensis]|uniref:DUF560 domain-containing protein n=1 Tax=Emcibacter nanhaiensis TaxID=1505037 RepID=A0A501PHB4_9PROT|nr:porin [Emcibacter nanhaiensis]TPD59850.1 DUF560 domain-containing protein [Emcibacter nanhaiensis]
MSVIKSQPGLATAVLLSLCAAPAIAEEKSPFELSLEVGAEYDSNITVDATDVTSRQGDEALLLGGAAGYQFVKNDDFKLKARYTFSQSLHMDLTEFDLQIHGASLEAGTKVGDLDLGLAYRYNYITLGSESFLDMHTINPTVSTLIGTKAFVTGGYEYLKQDFKQTNLLERNANRHSGHASVYFLLGDGRTINVGYKLSKHDTIADDLVYWGHTFDVGVKLPVGIVEDSVFRARYRYRQKDYSNIDLDLGEKRWDKKHYIRASLEAPFFESFTGKLEYEYTDSSSNLQTLNYDNHLVTFTLTWEL